MTSARVASIEICDFRGFPAEMVPEIKLAGKNLLLYGENGSGKSTLFQALAHLLDLRAQQPFDNDLSNAGCLKHRFTDPASVVGRVVLQFSPPETGPAHPAMEWRINTPRPVSHPCFRNMARTSGFLDYRAILRTHFLHYFDDGINLFRLIVETLLRNV